MAHLWHHLLTMGAMYDVNPKVFMTLYFVHHPLFWLSIGWLTFRVRRKQSAQIPILFAVFFWLMPYSYIFLFGKHLPWWAYVAAGVALVLGAIKTYFEIRHRHQRASACIPLVQQHTID